MTFKKVLLIGAAVSLSCSAFAQKSNVRKAKKYLDDAATATNSNNTGTAMLDLEKAKAAIDTAAVNSKTKDDPETWLAKASVYISMQANDGLSAENPYLTSYSSLEKAFSLDEKYKSKSDAIPIIMRTAFYAFNAGVNAYNHSKYDSAMNSLNRTFDLLGDDGDKRFADHKDVDTIRAQAKMIFGYSAYYTQKNEEAIKFLKDCAASPYLSANGANIYLILAQAYGKSGNKDQQLATVETGLKQFPNDGNLKNAELNYYIASGNTEVLIQKFEQRAQDNPNNPDAYFELGILYDQLANKDSSTPDNKDQYAEKAEKDLKKAISLNPDDPQMNYQLAAHYYNQAAAVNNVMSQMSASDMDKYNKLKTKRDGLFEKALPLLEKAKEIYEPKASSLTGDDHKFYVQTLQALAQIYTIQNKLDKAQANRDLLNNL